MTGQAVSAFTTDPRRTVVRRNGFTFRHFDFTPELYHEPTFTVRKESRTPRAPVACTAVLGLALVAGTSHDVTMPRLAHVTTTAARPAVLCAAQPVHACSSRCQCSRSATGVGSFLHAPHFTSCVLHLSCQHRGLRPRRPCCLTRPSTPNCQLAAALPRADPAARAATSRAAASRDAQCAGMTKACGSMAMDCVISFVL